MDTFRRVVEFVARQRFQDPDRLKDWTELYDDLHLYGDDVDEFFLAFAAEFNVDLSDLDVPRHFPPEGGHSVFLKAIAQLVLGRRSTHARFEPSDAFAAEVESEGEIKDDGFELARDLPIVFSR
jgi:hypothetical protein